MQPSPFLPVRESAGVPVSTKYLGVDTDALLRQTVQRGQTPATARALAPLELTSAWRITAARPGPAVTIFGGVHGFETCGVDAVVRLLSEFASGALTLSRGSLTLAIGNEQAVCQCERKIVSNLNRLFRDDTRPNAEQGVYESGRAVELCRLLRQTNFFLDLHSTSAPTRPFGIVSQDQIELVGQLGLDRALIMPEEWRSGVMAGTASKYAEEQGSPQRPCFSITVENGQHADEATATTAYEVTRRFLVLAKVMPGALQPVSSLYAVVPQSTVTREGDGFVYTRAYQNFDEVKAGEVIGRDNVREYRAADTGCILLPTPALQSKVGEELYFLGKAKWLQHHAA